MIPDFRNIARRTRRGMTLIELLLAMAGTAVVALATTAMLASVATGTRSQNDMRSLVVKHKSVGGRINAAIRSSKMILQRGDNFVVLWMRDVDADGAPALAELRYIERTSDGQLISYRAPADLASEDNTIFALGADFRAALDAIKGDAVFPAEPWSTGVASFETTANAADPQAATLLSYRMTLTAGDMQEIVIGAGALRNR